MEILNFAYFNIQQNKLNIVFTSEDSCRGVWCWKGLGDLNSFPEKWEEKKKERKQKKNAYSILESAKQATIWLNLLCNSWNKQLPKEGIPLALIEQCINSCMRANIMT